MVSRTQQEVPAEVKVAAIAHETDFLESGESLRLRPEWRADNASVV
jgi:hypothetical protein